MTIEKKLEQDLVRMYNRIQEYYRQHPEAKQDPTFSNYAAALFVNSDGERVANLTLTGPVGYINIKADIKNQKKFQNN